MKKTYLSLLIIGFLAAAWWTWIKVDEKFFDGNDGLEVQASPNPEEYQILLSELHRWKEDLSTAYKNAQSPSDKAKIEHDARQILIHLLPSMMDCWLGTEYNFDGTAEKPGSGKLACGYFVSTIIRDAGFRVNRYTLAQQASENILRSLISSDHCQLSIGESFPSFLKRLGEKKNGIYFIGLDSHVGFIVKTGNKLTFYHSSKWKNRGVVRENVEEAFGLEHSKWRMLGSFSEDQKVLQTWLLNEKVKVRTS